MRVLAAISVSIFAASAQACSGPNVQFEMKLTEIFAQAKLVVVCGLAVFTIVQCFIHKVVPVVPAIMGFLIATNPSFTVSAYRGDCGGALELLSWAYLAAAGALVAIQQVYFVRKNRRPH